MIIMTTLHCNLSGTDEKAIINLLSQRSNAQRLEIKKKFKAMFGRVVKGLI